MFTLKIDDDKKGKPQLWFTDEEIRAFIENNILSSETDEERIIDSAIKDMWEKDEHTRDYYYSFPKRWEDNGLAKLIRERVGVPYTARYEDPHYLDDYAEFLEESLGIKDTK